MPEHHAADRTTNSNRGVHPIMRFGDVANAAARNAIVQTSADKGGVVFQSGGDVPGYWIADGAGGWSHLSTGFKPALFTSSTTITAAIFDHLLILTGADTTVNLPVITDEMVGKQIFIANYGTFRIEVVPDNSGAPQLGFVGSAPGSYFMDPAYGVLVLMASGDSTTGYLWVIVSEPRKNLDDVTLPLSNFDSTDLTTGVKSYWIAKQDMFLKDVVATLYPSYPATGAGVVLDLLLNGTSILSTPLTIDDGAYTSVGSAAPYVFDASFVTAQQKIIKGDVLTWEVLSTPAGARGAQASMLGNYAYSVPL
jgi:hypothetical protein